MLRIAAGDIGFETARFEFWDFKRKLIAGAINHHIPDTIGFDADARKLLAMIAESKNDTADEDTRVLEVMRIFVRQRGDNGACLAAGACEHHRPRATAIGGDLAGCDHALQRYALGVIFSREQMTEPELLAIRQTGLSGFVDAVGEKLWAIAACLRHAGDLHDIAPLD